MSKILVIMAAGMGSRFGGDKQTANLGPSGEFLLEYSVYDALQAGFGKIIFVIRPGMLPLFQPLIDDMKSSFPESEFCYAYQGASNSFEGIEIPERRTKPLGTVHAVLSARDQLDSHFAVINADDFYGRRAFESLALAMDRFENPHDAALVTYSLKNTLSPYGAVTRGICELESGFLKCIREAYKVSTDENGRIIELTDSEVQALAPDTPVSMNMWAFNKASLPVMIEYFKRFLVRLSPDDNKSECLIPVMAGDFIEQGLMKIAAYTTSERWFGLTYRDDAKDAAWELDKRHEDGHYPKKLF